MAVMHLWVRSDVVERTGEDGHCDGSRVRAARVRVVVVVALTRRYRPDREPHDQDDSEQTTPISHHELSLIPVGTATDFATSSADEREDQANDE